MIGQTYFWASNANILKTNLVTGLSIGFEVDSDILKADGYGGRKPPHKRGVWGQLMLPAG